MKKMYAFLIIAAVMTTPSCNDSKKSETAESADKPKTACDCVKKSIQVLKDFKTMTAEQIMKAEKEGGMEAYMAKKLYSGNDCEKIMKENEKKYPSPEAMAKDCPAINEFIALMKEFGQGEASQPKEDMQNEDAGYAGESGDMAMPEDMEMPDMPEPEMPEDF